MHEIIDQIMHYARSIWRYRWFIHAVAWPVAVGGWLFVASMPDVYEVSARVHVDTQSMLRPLLRGLAVQTDVDSDVQVMTRTLLRRENLEKIVRMTDADLRVNSNAQMEALLANLKSRISFVGGPDNIYSISYTGEDPRHAKNVVQALLDLFIESSLGDSRKDSSNAQRFLDEQIAEYERRLFEAEERVKEFKRKNVKYLPGSGRDYFSILQAKQLELAQTRAQLEETTRRRDEIQRQITGEEPTFGLAQSNRVTGGLNHPLDGRIAELESRIDEMLLKYTERHPDIMAMKETLSRLERQRKKEIEETKARLPKGASIAPLEQNPVYQQLRISLAQSEAEVAAITARAERMQKEVTELEESVDTIPRIEAEMVRLNRDYDINKRNYDQLLTRRESAKLSQSAGQTADDLKFQVLEPPTMPRGATGPNRGLFNVLVLVGGLVVGLAFAFFMAQIKPTFDSTRLLSSATGLPVFGSVGIVRTKRETQVRMLEVAGFLFMAVLLVGLLAMTILLQNHLRSLMQISGS
jgi:polysaccharide chain length determinant protein (PEP-CTERM system associated)